LFLFLFLPAVIKAAVWVNAYLDARIRVDSNTGADVDAHAGGSDMDAAVHVNARVDMIRRGDMMIGTTYVLMVDAVPPVSRLSGRSIDQRQNTRTNQPQKKQSTNRSHFAAS
jgi:hypothetical protein